ncbi:hypothetical protein GUI12_00325 [Anaplasmataceae bacterium AB001_6]|nr:hypothetical protein GUI12_00325 [Anaplasmataceae bacterium AB001_6]
MSLNNILLGKIFHDIGNLMSYLSLYRDVIEDDIEEITKEKIIEIINTIINNFLVMQYAFNMFNCTYNYKDNIKKYFAIKDCYIDVLFNEISRDEIVVITNMLLFCLKNKATKFIIVDRINENDLSIVMKDFDYSKLPKYLEMIKNESENPNSQFMHEFMKENFSIKTHEKQDNFGFLISKK